MSEDPGIDAAVEEAMDKIRESYYLTTEVKRPASLQFVELLTGRLQDLADELETEIAKHGD